MSPLPTTGPFQTLADVDEQFVNSAGEATLSTGAVVGIVVAMLFLVAVLAVIMLLKYRRQKRRAASRQTISGLSTGSISVMVHGLASAPASGPKPSKNAQPLIDQELLDPKAAQDGNAASPPQLAGTLHKRSPTSGMYKKVKVSRRLACYLLFLPAPSTPNLLPPPTTHYLRPIIPVLTIYC